MKKKEYMKPQIELIPIEMEEVIASSTGNKVVIDNDTVFDGPSRSSGFRTQWGNPENE